MHPLLPKAQGSHAIWSDLMRKFTDSFVLSAVFLTWVGIISLAAGALALYKSRPAQDQLAPALWPERSRIVRSIERPTLLMFVHPHCSCSQASLEELARLMASFHGRVSAHAIFYRPATAPPAWKRGALWQAAAAIPDLMVQEDEGGKEAQLFHGETSGHTVMYSAHGERVFDGGITVSRGHAGDSFGRQALLELVLDAPAAASTPRSHTPIFGCTIYAQKGSAACGGKPCSL